MRIDAIRLFILAAKHLNVTGAAKEFRISQPAASRQLTQLQRELSVKLLKKSGRGIELTKSGQMVLSDLLPIVSQLEDLQKKYTRKRESLAIACNVDLSTHLVSSIVTQFSQQNPVVQLTLHVGNNSEIEELLAEGKIDIAIISNVNESFFSRFRVEPFQRESLVAFVPGNHLVAKNEELQISEIHELRLIIRSRRDGHGSTETALAKLMNAGMKFKIAMRCESAELVKEAVRRGAGVGFLYHNLIERELDLGEFKALKISGFNLQIESSLIYRKEKPLSRLGQELLLLLRASVPRDPPANPIMPQILYRRNNRPLGDHMRRSKLRY